MTDTDDPRAAAYAVEVNWERRMSRQSEDGPPLAELYNLILILENDERWQGVLQLNEFTQEIEKIEPPPFRGGVTGLWKDFDTIMARAWLQEHRKIRKLNEHETLSAIRAVAQLNGYHPIRDYYDGLVWDGEDRLRLMLQAWMGAAAISNDGPREELERYVQRVSVIWMLQAVKRIYEPGCKADYVLILEGETGLGKSTFVEVLARGYSMDTPLALGEKDSYQAIQGKHIAELAEMRSVTEAGIERAKTFISSRSDRFRVAYGRKTEDFPRQCVFIGTTELREYLTDPDGNRRYLPVLCTRADLDGEDGFRANLDQIWAEAVHRYKAGEQCFPDAEDMALFRPQQELRATPDLWELIIEHYLNQPENRMPGLKLTLMEIAKDALRLDVTRMDDRKISTRIGSIMHRLGWVKRRSKGKEIKEYGRNYYCRRSDDDDEV